jgi:hypothetical protein
MQVHTEMLIAIMACLALSGLLHGGVQSFSVRVVASGKRLKRE